jgi:hypothetical protein
VGSGPKLGRKRVTGWKQRSCVPPGRVKTNKQTSSISFLIVNYVPKLHVDLVGQTERSKKLGRLAFPDVRWARLLGKTAGQDCWARLPGKNARQECRASLPGKTAGQDCQARLPGKTAWQDCWARLQGKTYSPIKQNFQHIKPRSRSIFFDCLHILI